MPHSTISSVCAILIAVAAGCEPAITTPAASPGDYDRPVPASEPRKNVGLTVDLQPASDCEERFDLAVYEERGVELIAWDDNSGACIARQVNIRYLTQALDEATLLELVKKHAKTVKRSRP